MNLVPFILQVLALIALAMAAFGKGTIGARPISLFPSGHVPVASVASWLPSAFTKLVSDYLLGMAQDRTGPAGFGQLGSALPLPVNERRQG